MRETTVFFGRATVYSGIGERGRLRGVLWTFNRVSDRLRSLRESSQEL